MKGCMWDEESKISKFQLLPKDAKPVISFPEDEREGVYTEIVKEVKKTIEKYIQIKPPVRASTPSIVSNPAKRKNKTKGIKIPMPYRTQANVDDTFFVKSH